MRDFKSRWAWITHRLLPHWKKLDESWIPAKMQLLAMGGRLKPLICLIQ
ncbi:MAG TPA: hypothetical protein VJR89_22310 [Polyangiales bacterium]|nr:hypothetical protein [Polyangiales bacterium]